MEDINILLLYNRKRHTDDGKKALQIVKCIANCFESINLGPVYYADRDALPGTEIFDELARVINCAKVIICVMTKGFTGSEWNLWTGKIAFKHNLDRQDDEEHRDQLGQVSKQTFMLVRYRVPDDVFKKKCSMFLRAQIPEVPDDVLTGESSDVVDRFWKQVIGGAMLNQPRHGLSRVEEGLAQQQRRNPTGAITVNQRHVGRNEPVSVDGASGDVNTAMGELAEQFSESVSLRPVETHGSSSSDLVEDGPRATPETRRQPQSVREAVAAAAEAHEAERQRACRSPAAPPPAMQQQQTAAPGAEDHLSPLSTAGTTSGSSVKGATAQRQDLADSGVYSVDEPLSPITQAQSLNIEDSVYTSPPVNRFS